MYIYIYIYGHIYNNNNNNIIINILIITLLMWITLCISPLFAKVILFYLYLSFIEKPAHNHPKNTSNPYWLWSTAWAGNLPINFPKNAQSLMYQGLQRGQKKLPIDLPKIRIWAKYVC